MKFTDALLAFAHGPAPEDTQYTARAPAPKPRRYANIPREAISEARRLAARGMKCQQITDLLQANGIAVTYPSVAKWLRRAVCDVGYPEVLSTDPPYMELKHDC